MDSPVDNFSQLTECIANDELPHAEALVRLYELCERYELSSATQAYGSASAWHKEHYGHRLRFGCCSGLDNVPPETYHADLLHETPSLSASIAHRIITASPLHAWYEHPRLNPEYEPTDDPKFDRGTVAHSLLLDNSREVAIIDADDWRTKAAKEERDEARQAGKVPLLREQWKAVETLVRAIGDQLGSHHAEPPLLADGRPERTLVWEEDGGVCCRARPDWLRDDFTVIDDLKTTARSARPEEFSRNLYKFGYDLQAAFYVRGCEVVTGVRPAFRWIVAEVSPPYAVSVVSATPEVLALGDAKVEYALGLWRECLATDEWPAYSPFITPAAPPPPWEVSRWLGEDAVLEVEVPW